MALKTHNIQAYFSFLPSNSILNNQLHHKIQIIFHIENSDYENINNKKIDRVY